MRHAARSGMLAVLLLASAATTAVAQQDRCPVAADRPGLSGYGPEASRLPLDRVADLLALSPGTSALTRGELNVRSAGKGVNGFYLDGVPVLGGRRDHLSPSLGGSYSGEVGSGLAIGTNQFTALRLHTGLMSAELGNAVGGIIEVETTPCGAGPGSGTSLHASVASDAFLGAERGIGLNRLTLNGELHHGRFAGGIHGTAEGQRTELLGMEQNDSPVYLLDGVDTTVTFDDGAEQRSVDINNFRASKGIRIPASASTIYSLGGYAGYQLGERHRLRLTGMTSQRQKRKFDYQALYNPRQAFADRVTSQVLTASWFGRLRQSGTIRLSGEAHLSLQRDQQTDGPLNADGEEASRDPAWLMVSPLGFRFDRSNFAVNDALVDNFRTNTGRRSPYDLDNTAQYQLIDEYRNNPYGLLGWSEGGGPVGQLTLYHERRLVGKGALSAEIGSRHRLRGGIEATRYDVELYSAALTSQGGADAYVESPRLTSGFADYRLRAGDATIEAGVRLDHFSSGASRPAFPRISSMPGFDPSDPTAGFVKDEAHSRVSPRLSGEFHASSRAQLYAGITALAQVPDFTDLFKGINTDLSVTSSAQLYGTNLDFVTATLMEGGVRYLIDSGLTLNASAWSRRDRNIVVSRLRSEFDSLSLSQVDVRRLVNAGTGRATGLDLQLSKTFGSRGQAWVSYSFTTVDSMVRGGTRKHNAAAAVLYETGNLQALGGALRHVGIYAIGRVASGTAYTTCGGGLIEESAVVSDTVRCDIYVGNFNSARTPTISGIDLRLSRTIALGSASLVVFGDIRNLLNTRNVVRVFAQSGRTRNPIDHTRFQGAALDNWANEADFNGVRDPDGTIDLSFGGSSDPRTGCDNWFVADGNRPPNCIYLIEAERRFGNGDHQFTVAEQERAFDAYYYVARGQQNFTAPGRRVRFGVEVHF